eukprot:COSAG01_NODE_4336_length_5125_cov_64.626542_5_plen_78_part_00
MFSRKFEKMVRLGCESFTATLVSPREETDTWVVRVDCTLCMDVMILSMACVYCANVMFSRHPRKVDVRMPDGPAATM